MFLFFFWFEALTTEVIAHEVVGKAIVGFDHVRVFFGRFFKWAPEEKCRPWSSLNRRRGASQPTP